MSESAVQEYKPKPRPKVQSSAEQELDKAEAQFKEFDNQIKEMTMDRMNQAPKLDMEPQTKLSQVDLAKSKDIYLKPKCSISCREKFNERFREEYNFQKEYVYFIAENHEIIGESIDIWTRPFAGMPAEEWIVPVNTAVWGPRYLAEQIKRKYYHRLKMEERPTSTTATGQFYGQMAVDTTVPRLDARPATRSRSLFMGESGFVSDQSKKPSLVGV